MTHPFPDRRRARPLRRAWLLVLVFALLVGVTRTRAAPPPPAAPPAAPPAEAPAPSPAPGVKGPESPPLESQRPPATELAPIPQAAEPPEPTPLDRDAPPRRLLPRVPPPPVEACVSPHTAFSFCLSPRPAPVVIQPDLRADAPQVPGLFDLAPPPKAASPPAPPAALTTWEAIKAILGLLVLLGLAFLGGHPAVQRLERRVGVAQLVTAGFPFVIFGVIAASPDVAVLSPPVMEAIAPLLPLGLGWLGFAIGIRFAPSRPDPALGPVTEAFVLTTFIPFALMVGSASLLLYLTDHEQRSLLFFLRDAFILATAGAMTSRSLSVLVTQRGGSDSAVARMRHIVQLEELTAFVALIALAAFFRPGDAVVGWHLPSLGWVFMTLGIGAALGGLTWLGLGAIAGPVETLVVMLGSITFAAGLSSYLRLSPVVVCFIAGAVLMNLPGAWREQVRGAIARLERPVYLVFLTIAGAIWPIDDLYGWVLMGLFVLVRLGGRTLGLRLFAIHHRSALSTIELRHLAAAPMGALSIAIVITAQDLYSSPVLPWLVTAVLGGAIVNELVVHFAGPISRRVFPDPLGATPEVTPEPASDAALDEAPQGPFYDEVEAHEPPGGTTDDAAPPLEAPATPAAEVP
jgi:hypothetical protein